MPVACKDKLEVSGTAIESPPSCAPPFRYRPFLRNVASGSQIAALTENDQILTVTLTGLTVIFYQQGQFPVYSSSVHYGSDKVEFHHSDGSVTEWDDITYVDESTGIRYTWVMGEDSDYTAVTAYKENSFYDTWDLSTGKISYSEPIAGNPNAFIQTHTVDTNGVVTYQKNGHLTTVIPHTNSAGTGPASVPITGLLSDSASITGGKAVLYDGKTSLVRLYSDWEDCYYGYRGDFYSSVYSYNLNDTIGTYTGQQLAAASKNYNLVIHSNGSIFTFADEYCIYMKTVGDFKGALSSSAGSDVYYHGSWISKSSMLTILANCKKYEYEYDLDGNIESITVRALRDDDRWGYSMYNQNGAWYLMAGACTASILAPPSVETKTVEFVWDENRNLTGNVPEKEKEEKFDIISYEELEPIYNTKEDNIDYVFKFKKTDGTEETFYLDDLERPKITPHFVIAPPELPENATAQNDKPEEPASASILDSLSSVLAPLVGAISWFFGASEAYAATRPLFMGKIDLKYIEEQIKDVVTNFRGIANNANWSWNLAAGVPINFLRTNDSNNLVSANAYYELLYGKSTAGMGYDEILDALKDNPGNWTGNTLPDLSNNWVGVSDDPEQVSSMGLLGDLGSISGSGRLMLEHVNNITLQNGNHQAGRIYVVFEAESNVEVDIKKSGVCLGNRNNELLAGRTALDRYLNSGTQTSNVTMTQGADGKYWGYLEVKDTNTQDGTLPYNYAMMGLYDISTKGKVNIKTVMIDANTQNVATAIRGIVNQYDPDTRSPKSPEDRHFEYGTTEGDKTYNLTFNPDDHEMKVMTIANEKGVDPIDSQIFNEGAYGRKYTVNITPAIGEDTDRIAVLVHARAGTTTVLFNNQTYVLGAKNGNANNRIYEEDSLILYCGKVVDETTGKPRKISFDLIPAAGSSYPVSIVAIPLE